MKNKTTRNKRLPDDALDNLLKQLPLEEPPAWFETRVMARIRAEKEKSFWQKVQHVLSGSSINWVLPVGSAAALGTILILSFHFQHDPLDTNVNAVAHEIQAIVAQATVEPANREQIFDAFKAFEQYSEQTSLLSDDWL